MLALRGRLTHRDGDLSVLGLERVLWSLLWALSKTQEPRTDAHALRFITPEDIHELVRLGLRYGIDLTEEDVDRVFLNRATEHVLARRLLKAGCARGRWLLLLQTLAESSWAEGPYGHPHVLTRWYGRGRRELRRAWRPLHLSTRCRARGGGNPGSRRRHPGPA
jgi:hypothetical protein